MEKVLQKKENMTCFEISLDEREEETRLPQWEAREF